MRGGGVVGDGAESEDDDVEANEIVKIVVAG